MINCNYLLKLRGLPFELFTHRLADSWKSTSRHHKHKYDVDKDVKETY